MATLTTSSDPLLPPASRSRASALRTAVPAVARRATVLLAAGALLAGAACGGAGKEASAGTTKPAVQASSSEDAPPPVAPLTGLEAPFDVIERPALVLKIDNHNAAARPQSGINQADVIYEEQVEGGVTRLAAVFHSADADPVGPIRSVRTTDIAIVTPLNRPLLGFSGGNGPTKAAVADAPLVDVRWDNRPDLYQRVSHRSGPHNLYTSTTDLWDSVDEGEGGEPPALFQFRPAGTPSDAAGAVPVTEVQVSFGGTAGYGATWTWSAADGVWLRYQLGTAHVDAEGVQVGVANLIVQQVPYGVRYGNPEADLVGSGPATVFTDGKAIDGTWERRAADEVTRYFDAAGDPIRLTPGRTWIELPPVGRAPTWG